MIERKLALPAPKTTETVPSLQRSVYISDSLCGINLSQNNSTFKSSTTNGPYVE